MDLALYASFALAVSLLWFLPGPDWAFVIGQASTKQPWLAGVIGLALGYVVMSAVVAGGLGVLIASSPIVLTIITVIGASYLIALGAITARRMIADRRVAARRVAARSASPDLDSIVGAHPVTGPIGVPLDGALTSPLGSPGPGDDGGAVAPAVVGDRRPARASLAAGFAVSALNPKALIFFVALFPQFITPRADWPLAVQLLVLGLTWVAVSTVLYVGLSLASRRVFERTPAAAGWVAAVAATSMVVMGVVLIAEQLLGAGAH